MMNPVFAPPGQSCSWGLWLFHGFKLYLLESSDTLHSYRQYKQMEYELGSDWLTVSSHGLYDLIYFLHQNAMAAIVNSSIS